MTNVASFFHKETSTFTHVVYDAITKEAIIIDPVLDFEPLDATISFKSLNQICNFITQNGLLVRLVIDTHIHADHMSGSYFLKKRLSVPSAIGENFSTTQKYFAHFYDIDLTRYEKAYDIYLTENNVLSFASLTIKTFFTPGHTPTCATYLIGDALFVGDTIFQPSIGCGRTDFPGGSAQSLFKSITQHIFNLPNNTKIFVGHDYPKENEAPRPETRVIEVKKKNVMINESTSEEVFITQRKSRDQSLLLPKLYLFALQVNLLGGQLPFLNDEKKKSLTIPLTIAPH
jgi:glyoxylase-like metal-dependent hydrolase (beta-lactamase superfamily II)